MSYYRYEPQTVLYNSSYKLHCDVPVTTDRTVRNIRPDTVLLDKTIKQSNSTDLPIPDSHNLCSANTEKLQSYADLREKN
jgi:hypothetical protein